MAGDRQDRNRPINLIVFAAFTESNSSPHTSHGMSDAAPNGPVRAATGSAHSFDASWTSSESLTTCSPVSLEPLDERAGLSHTRPGQLKSRIDRRPSSGSTRTVASTNATDVPLIPASTIRPLSASNAAGVRTADADRRLAPGVRPSASPESAMCQNASPWAASTDVAIAIRAHRPGTEVAAATS